MLPDFERKLLRILINYPSPIHRVRVPDFKLLQKMTGRSKPDISNGLKYLEDNGYILWPDKSVTEGIEVIRYDNDPAAPKKRVGGNIDYWSY